MVVEANQIAVEEHRPITPPFPYMGGKARVADICWRAFGDVKNYVEPFAGSLAMLLARPSMPKIETVNDRDYFIANFWRAVQSDPNAVAYYCDSPTNEADLYARHKWLVTEGIERIKAVYDNPEFYDVQIAGWWAWGISIWIGGRWCQKAYEPGNVPQQRPHLSSDGQGLCRKSFFVQYEWDKVDRDAAWLAIDPCAIRRPFAFFEGDNDVYHYLIALARRLRKVRVLCGDWSRAVSPNLTTRLGQTAVFLDPPYAEEADRTKSTYAMESLTVAHDVRKWCIENGDDPKLKIILCGYEGEHELPDTWRTIAWKAPGGMGNSGENSRGRFNAYKERLWLSPHCNDVEA